MFLSGFFFFIFSHSKQHHVDTNCTPTQNKNLWEHIAIVNLNGLKNERDIGVIVVQIDISVGISWCGVGDSSFDRGMVIVSMVVSWAEGSLFKPCDNRFQQSSRR